MISTFPTRRHHRVHDLLARIVIAGVADYFADLCDLAYGQRHLKTTTHLLGHLCREVETATREVLVNMPGVSVHLDAEGTTTHAAEIDGILTALGIIDHEVAIVWRDYTGKGGWHKRAHRAGLARPRALDGDFARRVDRFVEVLAVVLDAAEAAYATRLAAALTRVGSQPRPTSDDADAVAPLLAPGVAAQSVIFDALTAAWLPLLRARGVFKNPPAVLEHDDGVSFPRWPGAAFLARIAAVVPRDVADVIVETPATNNEAVYAQYLDAAASMPPTEAVRVVRHVMPHLTAIERWRAGELTLSMTPAVARLLEGDGVVEAVELLRTALRLEPARGASGRGAGARLDSFYYGVVALSAVPLVASRAPQVAIDLLRELLVPIVAGGLRSWHGPISRPVRAGVDMPVDFLVAQLRDVYVARASVGGAELRAALHELDASEHELDLRLALHLLRSHGERAPDLVVARLCDPDVLADARLRDEVAGVLRAQLPKLSTPEVDAVVAALRKDASLGGLRRRYGEVADDDERGASAGRGGGTGSTSSVAPAHRRWMRSCVSWSTSWGSPRGMV